MVRLFQRNIILQALLIVVLMALLWGRQLTTPPAMVAGEHPAVLYGLLCRWMEHTPRMAVVLAMLLSLLEGVLLNVLMADTGLSSQNSLLPTFLFVGLCGAGATTLTPMLLVALCATLALLQLKVHDNLLTISASRLCTATALIGLATLFFQPAIALLLTYLFIAIGYRLYSWKDWMILLLGIMVPYVPLMAFHYLHGGIDTWWSETTASLAAIRFGLGTADTPHRIGSIVLTALFLWSLVYSAIHIGEHPIVWQRNAAAILFVSVAALVMLLYYPLWPLQLQALAIPASFSLYLLMAGRSHYSRPYRKQWIYDLMLITFILCTLVC